MEAITNTLRPLLQAHDFDEASRTTVGNTLSVHYRDRNGELPSEIRIRFVSLPASTELMVYIQANHLLKRIATMKVSMCGTFVGSLVRSIMLTLYPPASEAPALAYLPDIALNEIGKYLSVQDIAAVSTTTKRLWLMFRNNSYLWLELVKRDWPLELWEGDPFNEYKRMYIARKRRIFGQPLAFTEPRYGLSPYYRGHYPNFAAQPARMPALFGEERRSGIPALYGEVRRSLPLPVPSMYDDLDPQWQFPHDYYRR